MATLVELDASDNQLHSLPALGGLHRLVKLNLQRNVSFFLHLVLFWFVCLFVSGSDSDVALLLLLCVSHGVIDTECLPSPL
jgi:hypothetical protein